MYKLELSRLDRLFAAVSERLDLYIPTDTQSGATFRLWEEGMTLSSSLKTVKSAKDVFFPQTEALMNFVTEGKRLTVTNARKQCRGIVLFGVRACDAASFSILDRVFLSEPKDSYYQSRRENSVVVTLACNKPDATCFCSTFGIDAASPSGDVAAWTDNEVLYLKPLTQKGSDFTDSIKDMLTQCPDDSADEIKSTIAERLKKLPLASLKADAFGAGKTDEYFDSPQWKTLSETCLGCGTCTFVCPTCQCYDIKDYDTGKEIKRYRCWDSCMYSSFTKMSAGQPRLTQTERFRQRFMHKLVYFSDNNDGMFSCVGCGRCVSRCPVGLNIVKVMKMLGGKKDDGDV